MIMEAHKSALLLIDVQERLAPAIDGIEACLDHCEILLRAADQLGIPVVASEQYPQGLGHTVPRMAAFLAPDQIHEKRHFSCACDPGLAAALEELGREQIVLCGIEAHVCVLQTGLDLAARGRTVAVVADAVGSRRPESRRLALERMRANGIEVIDTEMAVFEWLSVAGTPEFKALMPLIK